MKFVPPYRKIDFRAHLQTCAEKLFMAHLQSEHPAFRVALMCCWKERAVALSLHLKRCYSSRTVKLVLFFPDLLAIAFACQRFFHAFFLARFQIKGVPLDLLDNVFGLHLAFKAAQSIFKGFAFLYSNLCQD